MNETSNSIWKKPWKGGRGLLIWFLVTVIAAFVVFFCLGLVTAIENQMGNLAVLALALAIAFAVAGVLAVAFVRWVCHWRNFRRFLFGLACFVTLIALFYVEEDWRGKHAWDRFKSQWEAQGEKFDFKDFIPPPVPADENFALTPIVASSYNNLLTSDGKLIPADQRPTNFVNRLRMSVYRDREWNNTNVQAGDWQRAVPANLKSWQTYYRTPAREDRKAGGSTETNEFPTAPQPQSPAADVLLALSKYDPALKALRDASRLPYARFPLDYEAMPPWQILLPHLSAMRDCGQVLRLRAIAELESGREEAALDDARLMLYLAGSVRSEPFLVTHLVRIALVQNALQPIWEGLAQHKWSEAELVELDQALARLNFLADYEFAMRGERTCNLAGVEYLRRSRNLSVLDNKFDAPGREFRFSLLWFVPSGWFYQNELTLARMYQQWILPVVEVQTRTVSPAEGRRCIESANQELSRVGLGNFFARMLLPAYGKAAKRFAHAQESVDLARVAIALERYRLAHGEYPETLELLAPKFIPELPHDIINGQPLHYHRTADGQFVLYSVGWNEKDDGGVVGLTKGRPPRVDIDKGDLVWRYPAK